MRDGLITKQKSERVEAERPSNKKRNEQGAMRKSSVRLEMRGELITKNSMRTNRSGKTFEKMRNEQGAMRKNRQFDRR